MTDQVSAWHSVASKLGLAIDEPCEIVLKDGTVIRAAAYIRNFGAPRGMVVDPDFAALRPFVDLLGENGFGFSAMEIEGDAMALIEVLADWGWSGKGPVPAWLPASTNRA